MVIALSGKKRSGKDTFHEFVVEHEREVPVFKFSFADAVKRYAEEYFYIDLKNDEKERIRFVLQGIGQMMREEVDKDYWVKRVAESIEQTRKEHENFIGIITDVRYKNEAEWALKNCTALIRIVNPSSPTNDTHQSEIDLDDFSFSNFLYNNSSLENYRKAVIEWIETQKKLLLTNP